MRLIIFSWVLLSAALSSFSQQSLLFTENFEQPSNSFVFDSGWANTSGSNRWVINNEYTGGGTYPDTPNQDSITGTITNAPYSTYLHIHDENAAGGIANANYNPQVASDRFAYTADGFCTLGITDVVLAFFYLSGGSPTAYGEVYYSIDGGPWMQTGASKYRYQTAWQYETISDPAFENVANLRLGFRWVNDSSASAASYSFSIDEIVVAGTYNQATGPQLSVTDIFPDTVCKSSWLYIQWALSAPLCDGSYRVELSDNSGGFLNPTNLGTVNIINQDTSGLSGVLIPNTLGLGNCYKVRLTRIYPLPAIISSVSTCFRVQACPNSITTLTPIVLTDPDTACSLSAIDVPFISTGTFNASNVYRVELSDSSGNFTTPQLIGTFPSRETYDPAIGGMPGNVSGLLPATPEGCNYFIRVRSTSPAAVGSLYGPFCIKHCDITTNETIDINACIQETVGITDSVEIDIHEWNTSAAYLPGNKFIVQLLDKMTLSVVNEGGLGVMFGTASTTITLTIPGLNDLLALGMMPGSYYMRVIADSSSNPWNAKGTIIRITIGAPADNPPAIVPDKPVYCNNEIADLLITPLNPDSDYEWFSPALNNSVPFFWDFNPLRIDFTGASVGGYTFRVREYSFGCYGTYSQPTTVFVATVPDLNITGDAQVCTDRVYNYSVPFHEDTYFEWSVSGGSIIDSANNEVQMLFDTIGNAEITIYAVNACAVRTSDYAVVVDSCSGCTSYFILYPDTVLHHYFVTSYVSGSEPVSYLWSWGDGATDSIPYPSHTYDTAGNYTICLTITDSLGCYDNYCSNYQLMKAENAMIYVNVIPAPDTVNSITPAIAQGLTLFPNPASGFIKIKMNGSEKENRKIELFNAIGDRVFVDTRTPASEILLDLAELEKGIYFIRLSSQSRTQSGKFIVME